MQIRFDGKTQQQKILFIQGEHNQTLVEFKLPLEYGGQALSGLTWTVRTVNLCTEEYYQYALLGTAEEDGVVLPWRVERYTTASPGDLEITLVGRRGEDVVAKFVLSGATVKQNTVGTIAPQESYVEVILAQMDERLEQMQTIVMHPTTVSETTYNFMTWDDTAKKYVDTGIYARGPEGPQGREGEAGKGLSILGHYDTLAELQAAVAAPEPGDAYNVGTTAPYDVYIYDAEKGWVYNGPIGAVSLKTAQGTAITLTDVIKDSALTSVELYGKSTQDGTPSPEAPVEIVSQDVGNVWASGKNLYNLSAIWYAVGCTFNVTNNIVEVTVTGENVILGNIAQGDANRPISLDVAIPIKSGGSHTFRYEHSATTGTAYVFIQFYDADGNPVKTNEGGSWLYQAGQQISFTCPTAAALVGANMQIQGCTVGEKITLYNIQLEHGDTATAWEPYTGTTYTVNKTLRGIPVESDGNYTDENGQQWICDTYNVATGEYVQRVKELVLTGDEDWVAQSEVLQGGYRVDIPNYSMPEYTLSSNETSVMCNQYQARTMDGIYHQSQRGINLRNNGLVIYDPAYNTADVSLWKAHLAELYSAGTPVIVDYALAEPIVTKVPANYILAPSPTCNILAGGAQMEVEYNNIPAATKRVYFALSDPGPREIPYTWAEISEMCKAADFKEIRHGDWKDITLTGEFYDAAADTTKSINALCRMEAAGIDSYYKFSDAAISHHIDFISKDCIPGALQYNATATNAGGFIGSMLHTTLNGESGIQAFLPPDVAAVIIEKRALCETKTGADATSWAWNNLGKLWLPSEFEVWGGRIWAEIWGCGQAVHYPIFSDGTTNHIIKGDGHNGSRVSWWCASSSAGSAAYFCLVNGYGHPDRNSAAYSNIRVPLCFRVA